jgi:hypothetical protein
MLLLNNLYPAGMSSGNYEVAGDPGLADIILINEWGPCEPGPGLEKPDPGKVNLRLAEMALALQRDRMCPIVGTATVQEALSQVAGMPMPVDFLVGGQSSGILGGGTGTAGEVHALKVAMNESSRAYPAFFANAHHVGRVTLHARRQGITRYAVPPELPNMFRPESRQPMIRTKGIWVAREIIGARVACLQDIVLRVSTGTASH